jgi:hypothetical protein
MKIKYKIKQLCFTDARHTSLLKQHWRDVLWRIAFFQLQCPLMDCISFNYNVLWRIAFLSITMFYEGLNFFQLQCPMKDCILSITMSSDGLHFFQLQCPMKDCVSFNYNVLWRIAFLSNTICVQKGRNKNLKVEKDEIWTVDVFKFYYEDCSIPYGRAMNSAQYFIVELYLWN